MREIREKMNSATCWYCDKIFEYGGDKYQDVNCPHCGVMNSIYNPNNPECKPENKTTEQEWLKKEEGMLLGGKFLKVSDCKTGDTIEFLDGGVWEESRTYKNDDGTPKHQCQFQIKHGGEEKTISLNKTNREALIASWGRDTDKWIGKSAEITLKEVEVAGEDKTVIRLKAVA